MVTAFTIDGGASTTANRNVRLDVVASDQGNPASGVAGVYFVEYQWDMTLGIWKPILHSPIWQFYPTQTGSQADAAPATFGWQLAAVPGMRYLQVWAVDAAGNISVSPQQAYINYVPDTLQVAGGDAAILRFPLAANDRIRVRIEPVRGDPDVYLWAPDALTLPRQPWFANLGGVAIDEVSVVAPVAGTYQVEVPAYTSAAFRLIWEISPADGADVEAAQANGIAPTKAVHGMPVVAPTSTPGEQYALTPPTEANTHRNFLPVIAQ